MSNNLELRTIYDLLGEKFLVPSYQRGYRWGKTQVEQLLEDIWEFAKKPNKNESEFYCLQPIIVRKRNGDKWELIDGQQRLTTIFLILKFIEEKHLRRPLKEAYKKEIFEIDYEVRGSFISFINNTHNKKDENIDFYYIDNAMNSIKGWFEDKQFDFNSYNKFLSYFLAKKDGDNPVKVIWYEVDESADGVEIFTRLNIGKIPLTNAELIRALFLHKINPDSQRPTPKQLQIASEWDEIENTLQKDEFWYFIFNTEKKSLSYRKYDTRIEYIFDLMKEGPKDAEDYYTFYEFYKDLQNKSIETLWKEIKKYFYTFKEWYENNEFYHLIGYLIATGSDIATIKKEYDKKTKTEFKEFLKKGIKKTINNNTITEEVIEEIKNMQYGDRNVTKVLLLFNILILLNNKGASMRFPFDRYKREKWDIEHVFSQTEIELKGKALKEYIKLILEFWTGDKIKKDKLEDDKKKELRKKLDPTNNEIQQLFDNLIAIFNGEEKKLKDSIIKKLISVFKETEIKNRNLIYNLVLLDSATNRAYKNAFFPIKRKIILDKIKNGSFVPIGTQNVFLKAYSKRFDNIMDWTEDDAKDYLNAVVEAFRKFFDSKIGGLL